MSVSVSEQLRNIQDHKSSASYGKRNGKRHSTKHIRRMLHRKERRDYRQRSNMLLLSERE